MAGGQAGALHGVALAVEAEDEGVADRRDHGVGRHGRRDVPVLGPGNKVRRTAGNDHLGVAAVAADTGVRGGGTPPSSVTTPVQQPYSSGPPAFGRSATGCSSQRTRSAELMWPHAILWWRADAGLYWKKTWYRPLRWLMPLGSLIQPRAGRGWKCGNAGRGARRPGWRRRWRRGPEMTWK
ncbi:hypothetical protein AHiyo4_39350 [Arthrobacter sp. Hiyo4]|nr:hypothetical protein AHiyo4_39350 [Arthrobacter sp. Hiyo4]